LLIRGEPGVGKDILARLIHAATARHPNSFIKVNCGGQPEDRVEADLFGHEMGACPLALRQRLGSFEFAHHGTVYLEEIGALPRTLVPKLLYVLRTGEVLAHRRPRDHLGRWARHRLDSAERADRR